VTPVSTPAPAADGALSRRYSGNAMRPMLPLFDALAAGGDDAFPARLTGSQSSGMLTSMSAADALLVVPPDPAVVHAGTRLRALSLSGDLGGSARVLA
jgi:molybdopterin biosynthesis enzyme